MVEEVMRPVFGLFKSTTTVASVEVVRNKNVPRLMLAVESTELDWPGKNIVRLPAGFLPTLAGPVIGNHDKAIIFDAKLDPPTETILFNEGFGNTYTARVADAYQFDLHLKQSLS